MDQMQSNEDALQKAIDDITNNNSTEQSTETVDMPDLTMPEMPVAEAAPVAETAPTAPAIPEPEIPIAETTPTIPEMPVAGPITDIPAPEVSATTEAIVASQPQEPTIPETPVTPEEPVAETPVETSDIKEKALRDLVPILSKININAEQKFRIYLDMIEVLGDATVYSDAYTAASQITDDEKRGEALLKLIEKLD